MLPKIAKSIWVSRIERLLNLIALLVSTTRRSSATMRMLRASSVLVWIRVPFDRSTDCNCLVLNSELSRKAEGGVVLFSHPDKLRSKHTQALASSSFDLDQTNKKSIPAITAFPNVACQSCCLCRTAAMPTTLLLLHLFYKLSSFPPFPINSQKNQFYATGTLTHMR